MTGLDLADYMDAKCPSRRYELVAVIKHTGGRRECGHYTSNILDNLEWYNFDDAIVTRINPDVVTNEAYVANPR
jgi:ubiquitin C-terminal hydrolase